MYSFVVNIKTAFYHIHMLIKNFESRLAAYNLISLNNTENYLTLGTKLKMLFILRILANFSLVKIKYIIEIAEREIQFKTQIVCTVI